VGRTSRPEGRCARRPDTLVSQQPDADAPRGNVRLSKQVRIVRRFRNDFRETSKPDNARLFKVLQRVSRVDDQLGALYDSLVVETRVIRDNDDRIGRADIALKFLGTDLYPVDLHGQDVRIAVGNTGATLFQQMDDVQCRRLPHIIDVSLIGNTQDVNVGSAHGLSAIIESVLHLSTTKWGISPLI